MAVVITSPASGAELKGTVIVTGTYDGTGFDIATVTVGGVQLGSDTAQPISIPLDTTRVADGTHTLTLAVRYVRPNGRKRWQKASINVNVRNAVSPPPPPPPSGDYPVSWLSGSSANDIFKSVIPAPGKGVLVGIWDSGHPGISRITQRESEVGRRLDIGAGSYYGSLPNSDGKITLIKQGGRIPLCDAGHFGAASASEIINGSKDAWIRQWVRAAQAIGGPVLVRYFHEYAGPWMAPHWIDNARTRRCTAAEWKIMCQRPIDISRQEGTTNLIWVWCPTVYDDRAAVYASYPGDSYVDVVGDDAYGYADQQWMGYEFGWATHAMAFNYPVVQYPAGDPRREELKAPHEAFPQKPFGCMETGRAPHSTDAAKKPAWIREIVADIPRYLQRTVIHIYSDYGTEADPNGKDWSLSTPGAIEAYRDLVSNPYFKTRPVSLAAPHEEESESVSVSEPSASLVLPEYAHLRMRQSKEKYG